MKLEFQAKAISALAFTRYSCVVLLFCLPVFADPGKHQTHIIVRDELSRSKRDQLTAKLRLITGWVDLQFDKNGCLQIGEEEPLMGSATARQLLSTALSGPNILILEDASNREDVVFSRVTPGRWRNEKSISPPVYVVLIDFADFQRITGDKEALASFNVGWGLLHEIDHVENDSSDSEVFGSTGECENHINQMRRECHLPERSNYFYTYFPNTEPSDFSTRIVRLAFEAKVSKETKSKRYWIVWDAVLVGGISTQVARAR